MGRGRGKRNSSEKRGRRESRRDDRKQTFP
jgi:hypothetical protein